MTRMFFKGGLLALATASLIVTGGCGDDPEDVCEGVECPAPDATCEGETAVSYSGFGVCIAGDEGAECDFSAVRTETDCTATGQVCEGGACVADPCAGVDCTPPVDTCEGDIAVTYTGAGVCDPATQSCDFSAVREETDCAANGQICANGACVADPCDGVTCDTPPADACEGDTLVTYSGAGECVDGNCDYTAARTATDCTATDQVCREAACVDPDPCEGITCEQPADTCEGQVALTYSGAGVCVDGECDYTNVEMTEDCAAQDLACVDGACVDVCDGVTCEAPANECVGLTAVSYSGAGTCVIATGECDYTAVSSEIDCSSFDPPQGCENGACVADPCAGVDCSTPPADFCDGDVAVQYSGAGVCVAADQSCDFSGVETRDDCAASGEICANGVCTPAGPPRAPEAGELVITEIIQNPDAVGDSAGEWFEILNVSSAVLELDGLVVSDNDTDSFTVAGSNTVDPGAYFVFGNNGDTAANGGVTVDYVYSGMSLANGADEVVLTNASGVEIDRVEYDGGTVWPDPTGASMQLDGDLVAATADNNVGTNWCETPANVTYGDGDAGTPGAANASCAPPAVEPVIVTVFQIQDEAAAGHPTVTHPVIVNDVTVTYVSADNMWVQDPAGGANSGLYVDPSAVDVSALNVGDTVNVEGTYGEPNDRATIEATAVTFVVAGTAPTPQLLSTSDLAVAATAETWEGVLVQVLEAGVTNENPDAPSNFGEHRLDAGIRVNDLLYAIPTAPANCDVIESLTGILDYSFGNYKIEPRSAADVGTITTATTGASGIAVGVAATGFTPPDVCLPAGGGDVVWTNAGATDLGVQSREPATGVATSTPIDVTVTAGGTVTSSLTDSGTYHYQLTSDANVTGRTLVLE